MKQPVLVTAAWPYANAFIHVGNLSGAYLPADIFARYQRLKGRDTLFVSGTDAHGTPITVRADDEKTTPKSSISDITNLFWKCSKKLAFHMIFSLPHTRKTILKSLRISFSPCKRTAICIKPLKSNGMPPVRKSFCRTDMSKEPAISAGMITREVTNVINAGICWIRKIN